MATTLCAIAVIQLAPQYSLGVSKCCLGLHSGNTTHDPQSSLELNFSISQFQKHILVMYSQYYKAKWIILP